MEKLILPAMLSNNAYINMQIIILYFCHCKMLYIFALKPAYMIKEDKKAVSILQGNSMGLLDSIWVMTI